MPTEVTRRRFVFQTLGVIGGTMVAGELLPLLAEAARRKPCAFSVGAHDVTSAPLVRS